MKLRHVIIFVYNSSGDPLVQGGFQQFLLHATHQQPDLRLHIITYEQENYAFSPAQQEAQRVRWQAANIEWYPLNWHSGRLMPLKKFYDFFLGFLLCLRLRATVGAHSIMAFGTLAGGISLFIAKVLRLRYYVYQYEPHSEFMLDCNVWAPTSFAYRSLHALEVLSTRHADILSTGTRHMMTRLKNEGSPAQLYLLPSCVDEERIQFSPEGRVQVRARYGFRDEQPVFLYLGKFGSLYYEQEVPDFFAVLRQQIPATGSSGAPHLFVVTPDAPDYVAALMQQAGLPESSYTITRSKFEEVPAYISAADFGLVAVPPTPAQRFRSPIKVGEYLCCGLPYLTCRGVSEDDRIAEEYNVGVVVTEFSAAEAGRVSPRIAAFLAEDDHTLRMRCRQAGVTYRGLGQYLSVADEIFSQL